MKRLRRLRLRVELWWYFRDLERRGVRGKSSDDCRREAAIWRRAGHAEMESILLEASRRAEANA